MRTARHRLVCAAAAVALAGCAITSPQQRPDVRIPEAWNEAAAAAPGASVPLDWWLAFQSAELAQLIAAALAGSPDLAIAAERVRQAEAQVRVAGASLYPTLDLSGRVSRIETRPRDAPSLITDVTSVGLAASYEIDLWGRLASGVRGAESSLAAREFDRDAVRLTLTAGVATAYFDVRSLRGRLLIARDNLAIAERVLAVVDARVRNGAASPLDLARQRTAVLGLRAAIPPLEVQERQTLAALAILVGRPPEGFRLEGVALVGLGVPVVAPGLPAELLVRRPDLASAEAQLAAANADIAAARAALLPAITLTGAAGVASGTLLSLGSASGPTLSIAAALLQPIFDGGRRSALVDVATSRERELVEVYRAAILAALADVESALAATTRTAVQEEFLTQARDEARRALSLAEIRYREGADDLLVVLDAQRTLFQAQDQLALTRLARLQASVGLYRALGGGWTLPVAAADAKPADAPARP